ncbi:MAG TPA: NCS2 family permease, partial [Nitrospinaceae bacterium]|nr:NCS2 family permease [Nitrospinaceae bacterium]
NLSNINWKQWDEALPSYLMVIGMPLTYSIADGMALGFISYPLIKVFSGKAGEVHWCLYLIALLFILRYWSG